MATLLAPAVLTLVFLFVALCERVPSWRFVPAKFARPYLGSDVAWYLLATVSAGLMTMVLRPQLERLAIPSLVGGVDGLPRWMCFLLAIVIFDLVAFVVHVRIHRSDTLWLFHKVHHSSLHLDWLATTRTHVFELLIRNVPAQLMLFALGFDGVAVTVALFTYAVFAVMGHSNLAPDLRWAEAVFVTPRLHRLHHVPATAQRNFGTVFSVWDRVSGRLVRRDKDPAEQFGVPGERETYPQRIVQAFGEPRRQLFARRRQHRRDGVTAVASSRAGLVESDHG